MTVPVPTPAPDRVMDLSGFKELLLRTCGHGFEQEREQALLAAICRRMAELDMDGYDPYHALLLRDHDELLRLTELLTVNETYFFREPDHLKLMIDLLVPEFMAAGNRNPIRIVSAGCSTGEEPYSIAIMLRERFGISSERLFTIIGVDIDSTVISTARQGVYGKSSFRGMDQSLLERYFEPCGSGRFRVNDSIRNQVGFEVANLLGPSYPPGMQQPDIILYRNVSIYFPGQVQREIFGRLAELLAEGGCLLVGASETFHHDIGILSLVKQQSLFYYRKSTAMVFDERRSSRRLSRTPGSGRNRSGQTTTVLAANRNLTPERRTGESSRKQPHPVLPLDVRERFDAAVELAHKKEHDKALAVLDGIIDQDGTFLKAYCLKGSLLLSTSRYAESLSVCNALIGRDPLCLEAYLMLGIIARQQGDDDAALARFRETIYLNAACWPAHFYSAEILFARQQGKRARSSFESALRILEKGTLKEHGQAFFPLMFNAEQFMVICRHKLSLLASIKG